MDLKDSKTRENLLKALAGESIARYKYAYFAQAARQSGSEDDGDGKKRDDARQVLV